MTPVLLTWPGGEHEFALRLGELRTLQDNCNAGPEEVHTRLRLGTWRVDDIIEPIRLGLIGGGMPRTEAGPLVPRMIEQHHIIDFRLLALEILNHALLGVEDDPVGEPEGATTPPENGASPESTATGG